MIIGSTLYQAFTRFYLILFLCAYADGSVHNLNEYNEIHAAEVLTNLPVDLARAVSSQKHGVVVGEAQLEELFSRVS